MAICCVPSVTTNQVLGILNHQLVTTKQMLLKHLTFSRTNPLVPRLDTVLPPALKPPPFCQGGKEARADVATPNTPPMAVTVNTHCVSGGHSPGHCVHGPSKTFLASCIRVSWLAELAHLRTDLRGSHAHIPSVHVHLGFDFLLRIYLLMDLILWTCSQHTCSCRTRLQIDSFFFHPGIALGVASVFP